jgi:pilus assembly protein TadC
MISLTFLFAMAATLAWPSRRLAAMRRLRRMTARSATPTGRSASELARRPEPAPARRPAAGGERGRWGAAGVAGLAVATAMWSWPGVVLGLVVALLLGRFLARLEPRAARLRRERIDRDRVLAADLLAACLAAGASPVDAAAAVIDALGGPVGHELRSVIGAVRLGAAPAAAWLRLCREPGLAPLGRACARAVETGAPLAETVGRLAEDQRAERRSAGAEAARRAGVAAAAPLGLCFLPAFLLLGVVPVLLGIAGTLFSW